MPSLELKPPSFKCQVLDIGKEINTKAFMYLKKYSSWIHVNTANNFCIMLGYIWYLQFFPHLEVNWFIYMYIRLVECIIIV